MGGVARARNLVFLMFSVVVSGLGGGCSFVPTAEIKVFRESVVAANTAATPVLDELSAAERTQMQKATEDAEQVNVRKARDINFDPGKARLFSNIGDAPATAMFRHGHAVLDRLSDILLGLAQGTGAEADADSVESLVSEITSLVAVPGFETAAVKAGAATLKPFLEQVSKDLKRRQARQIIDQMEAEGVVDKLVETLVTATPDMFKKLTEGAKLYIAEKPSEDSMAAYGARVKKMRLVMSNYVVLLEEVRAAWKEAAKAEKSRSTGNIGVLTERVSELKAAAVATRKAFADMNATR